MSTTKTCTYCPGELVEGNIRRISDQKDVPVCRRCWYWVHRRSGLPFRAITPGVQQ